MKQNNLRYEHKVTMNFEEMENLKKEGYQVYHYCGGRYFLRRKRDVSSENLSKV